MILPVFGANMSGFPLKIAASFGCAAVISNVSHTLVTG